MITGIDGNNSNNIYNYILNNTSSLSIDVSSYATGNYVISLIHNGEVTDSKILIKN
jgi:hypothetical protein